MDKAGRKVAHLAQKRQASHEDFENTLEEAKRVEKHRMEAKRKHYFAAQKEQLRAAKD